MNSNPISADLGGLMAIVYTHMLGRYEVLCTSNAATSEEAPLLQDF